MIDPAQWCAVEAVYPSTPRGAILERRSRADAVEAAAPDSMRNRRGRMDLT
jgi:hypothetical protein